MKRDALILLGAAALLLTFGPAARAQTDELKKFEVGAHFSALSIDEGFRTRTEPGVGGRFTFNLTENLALEAEGNIFGGSNTSGAFRTGGRPVQGFAGVKIGKRFQRFGLFAKARPGLVSFSEGLTQYTPLGPASNPFSEISVRSERLTHPAVDLGGVLEIYHGRRLFTRFDAGDTIIRYGRTTVDIFSLSPAGALIQSTFNVPGDKKHNFQFSAGVGFRF